LCFENLVRQISKSCLDIVTLNIENKESLPLDPKYVTLNIENKEPLSVDPK